MDLIEFFYTKCLEGYKEAFAQIVYLSKGRYKVELWGASGGINEEYSTGDKCIAWSVFCYSIIYKFFFTFLVVLIWNLIDPWPAKWWAYYFVAVLVVIPGIAALVSSFWFGIGGIRDLYRFLFDLKHRDVIETDNGIVEKKTED